MGANQQLFWEVFLTFCFFYLAIALGTHWVILSRRKKKKRPKKNNKNKKVRQRRK